MNDTMLMAGFVETSPEPHLRRLCADVAATAACEYVTARMVGDRDVKLLAGQAAALVDKPATMVRSGTNLLSVPLINAVEGRIFRVGDNTVGWLPKGSRRNGLRIGLDTVLRIYPGYNKAAGAQADVDQIAGELPALVGASAQDIIGRCTRRTVSNQIQTVCCGTLRLGGCRSFAVWFISNVIRSEQIAEGFLWVEPDSGLWSEHGSVPLDGAGSLTDRFAVVDSYDGTLTTEQAFDTASLGLQAVMALVASRSGAATAAA